MGTLFNLGLAYQDTEQFNSAYEVFANAIDSVELLRGDIISGNEAKQKLSEEWNKLYRKIVEVCIKIKYYTQAIEYVERSKARNFIDLLANRHLSNVFPPDIITILEQLKSEVAIGQYQLQNGTAENPKTLTKHLHNLRWQRKELEDRYLPIGNSFKFNQIQTILDKDTALIEWYIADDTFFTFIVNHQTSQPIVWQSSLEDKEALVECFIEYIQDYYDNKSHWYLAFSFIYISCNLNSCLSRF